MKKMITRLGFFLFGLLCLPTAASAAIVNIEYSAHVYATTGDGMGYKEGDLLSGTFVVDTSKALGKSIDEVNEVWYYGLISSGLLQSNFATNIDIDYYDYVSVYNDTPAFGDLINMTKVLNAYGSTLESLGISFQFNGLDWISNLALNNINLVANEGGWSNGAFARWDLTDWSMTDSANFWLDSAKITSTSVPEPAPFVLLAIAAAGLMVRRRAA